MNAFDVVAVIQARMGSTRLPGKILLEAAGVPVLGHVIRRVAAVRNVGRVVVATSTRPADDRTAEVAERFGADVIRGSEHDVLDRFERAFDAHGGEVGIRVTADCPLLDPALIEEAVDRFASERPPLDYLSNTVLRSYPRGYDFEVFRVQALRDAAREARDPVEREHVTPFLYRNPHRFRAAVFARPDHARTSDWRLTLDTVDDWRLLRHVIERLAPQNLMFGLAAVEALIEREPEILDWNRHVEQRAH